MTLDRDALMEFAVHAAERAGRYAQDHLGRTEATTEADGSEVTPVDHAVEEMLRALIAERFPDDAILGEEGAEASAPSERRWIVDPIDGTRAYAHGIPLYAITLGLEVDHDMVLGCVHVPALGETIVATLGAGAYWNGRRARVSETDDLAAARVVTSGLEYWRDWASDRGRAGFDDLVRRCRFARTWGDAYGYVLLATGRVDVFVDPACGEYWDYGPLLPILAESGGRMTTLTGQPLRPWRTLLASNGRLHDAVRALWGDARDRDLQSPEVWRRQVDDPTWLGAEDEPPPEEAA